MEEGVSFVVLTKNNENTIGDCLASIYCQNYSNFEIIVVDGGSTDKTLQILDILDHKCAWKLKVYAAGGNIGESRQLGVEKAKYNLIAFIDSDCRLPDPFWLEGAVEKFNYSRVAGVWSLGTFEKSYPIMARYSILSHPLYHKKIQKDTWNWNYIPVGTGHTIIRKDVIIEAGGFKNLSSGEDVELTHRICNSGNGYCFTYYNNPVYHLHATSLKQFMSKYKRDIKSSENSFNGKAVFNFTASLMFFLHNCVFSWFTCLKGLILDRDIAWLLHPFISIYKVLYCFYIFCVQPKFSYLRSFI